MAIISIQGAALGIPVDPTTGSGDDAHDRVRHFIEQSTVFLFIKGTPRQPACGFTGAIVDMFNRLGVPYGTFNVLADPDIRAGAKTFANWPTFPQVYVAGEMLGGVDIARQMYESGELEGLVKDAISKSGPGALHASPAENDTKTGGTSFPPSAAASGPGSKLIQRVTPAQLRERGVATYVVLDVRDHGEASDNSIAGATHIPLGDISSAIDALPGDANLLVVSAKGERAKHAANFLLAKGLRHVHLLEGGLEAYAAP